jgi:heme/copper-type cytochrome/quinol oxidase subunit 3
VATINTKRVWIGGLVGGLVWFVWASVLNFVVLMPKYVVAQEAGMMLKEPRYPVFPLVWSLDLLALGVVAAWAYAAARATLGPGPKTAVKVGLALGFAAGFPVNFYPSAWVPFSRLIPLGWLFELGVGAVLATLVAGWLYRES